MASYEKIIKYVVEKFQEALVPLHKIVENQEIIIRQNTEFKEMLNKIYHRNIVNPDEILPQPDDIEKIDQTPAVPDES